MVFRQPECAIERLAVSACTVPTETPESDGTLEWDSTTLVLVEVEGGAGAGSATATPTPRPPG